MMSDLLTYILSHEDSFRRNRLPSLYSDFTTQKHTNPDGYAVNILAWERALTNAARHGRISKHAANASSTTIDKIHDRAKGGGSNHLVLCVDDNLFRDLESPEWGRPVGLGNVFKEALRKRTMVPLLVYKTSTAKLNQNNWQAIGLSSLNPQNIVGWGFRQLKGILLGQEDASSSNQVKVQELVFVENVKEAGSRVTSQATMKASSRFDLIYSKEVFIHDFATVLDNGSELSDLDFEVLLLYLSRDCEAIAYDGKTIKFRSSEDPAGITEQDTAIASIKTLIANLSQQIDRLELKIAELTISAKSALANQQRVSALSALRSRKMAENAMKQRSDTRTQLEDAYGKIEQAANQVEVVHVLEASTGILRGLNAKVGGLKQVGDVMEELRSEMDKTDEASTLIGSTINEIEVDEELEVLLKQELQELQTKEDKESEAIRQKLAELDRFEQTAKSAAQEVSSANSETETALSENISKISRISLEDPVERDHQALKAE